LQGIIRRDWLRVRIRDYLKLTEKAVDGSSLGKQGSDFRWRSRDLAQEAIASGEKRSTERYQLGYRGNGADNFRHGILCVEEVVTLRKSDNEVVNVEVCG
jgi:hypothetical protein